ncbi:MAG: leucine-rich repeat domain-containing protein, partial [Oscillospiraceae bacterium]|nr:leucine-rich repeat domain-containing protein [Oscillospiraceae bacterium]
MRKFKTALALLLTLALAVQLSTAALADDATSGTCGENVTWSLNTDTGVLTISGEGEIEYQEIDEPPWYSQREYITEVVIEEGVTGISDYAFLYCLNLASVTIPASVTYIGYLPFVPCPRLTKILVSEENEYYTSVDGVLFDKDMTELICYPAGKADTSYAIPSGVAIIDIGAFGYSFNLTSVTVPETVTDIGLEAFVCCTALTKILVSDSSTAYCSADGVLFSKDMTSLICYPEGKTDVSYTIPDGVTYIEHAAFAFCTSLTDVTIPKSVTAIGDNAFYSYDKEILSEEINEGSYHGFYTIFLECATLSDVYYCGSEDEWNAIEIGNYNTGLETATIHYNSVAEDTDGTGDSGDSEIISGTCGENLTWTLVDGVLTISGTGEMEDTLSPSGIPWNSQRSSITSVIIEDGVTTISSFAFWDCSSLTSVTIPDSVTSIGSSAFSDCTGLTNVTIGNGVTSIGSSAFSGC